MKELEVFPIKGKEQRQIPHIAYEKRSFLVFPKVPS